MTIKILIVDDRAVVRAELRAVLELSETITVVGEAADGWEALHQAEKLRPDIVLMDLEMPGLDGFEATRRIKAQHLARAVIIFTVYGSEANRLKAVEAGADAFLIKGTDLRILLNTFESFSHQEA
jgi:two-component system, NarL family, response regulator